MTLKQLNEQFGLVKLALGLIVGFIVFSGIKFIFKLG